MPFPISHIYRLIYTPTSELFGQLSEKVTEFGVIESVQPPFVPDVGEEVTFGTNDFVVASRSVTYYDHVTVIELRLDRVRIDRPQR